MHQRIKAIKIAFLLNVFVFLFSSSALSFDTLNATNPVESSSNLSEDWSEPVIYFLHLMDWNFYALPAIAFAAQPLVHYCDAVYKFHFEQRGRVPDPRRYLGSTRTFSIQMFVGLSMTLYGGKGLDLLYASAGIIHTYFAYKLRRLAIQNTREIAPLLEMYLVN